MLVPTGYQVVEGLLFLESCSTRRMKWYYWRRYCDIMGTGVEHVMEECHWRDRESSSTFCELIMIW